MTPRQLHYLKPGDIVAKRKGGRPQLVHGVVVYLDKDSQTVDAVKIGGTMYQREEMLRLFKVVKDARRRG